MAGLEKVRVLVVGDSGVGKTSLVHLIANEEACVSPGWTVGCSVEVKLHEYKDGIQNTTNSTYFIEFYDIGGSIHHANTRSVFYNPTHAVILVHDLTNSKSHENLQRWLLEILNKEGKDVAKGGGFTEIDPEQFVGIQMPILIVGTKADLCDIKTTRGLPSRLAEQCGAEEININCLDARSMAPGTTNAIKLSHFFDRVIERKYYKDPSGFIEKRRYNVHSANSSPNKVYSPPQPLQ